MVEKPKRKQKGQPWPWWTKFGIAFVIVLAVGGVAFFAFTMWAMNDVFGNINFDWQGDEARTKAQDLLDVTFPDEAANFHMHYITWQDWHASIRFEIPATVGTGWVSQQLCFGELARNPGLIYVLPNDSLDWWQPQQSEDNLSGSCGNDPYYHILIDQTDPNTWIVYLTAYKT